MDLRNNFPTSAWVSSAGSLSVPHDSYLSAQVAAITVTITHLSSVASCCDVSLGDVITLVELELLPCPPEPPPLPAPVAAVTIACLFCSRISFLRW
jgi:hypothetical protein